MRIRYTEGKLLESLSAYVIADDGFEIKFFVDLKKEEVTELYMNGDDYPPAVGFATSLYAIIEGKPKSIAAIISEINADIPEIKREMRIEECEQQDYEATASFYWNHGRI